MTAIWRKVKNCYVRSHHAVIKQQIGEGRNYVNKGHDDRGHPP
jgi:hypothetical protein